MRTPLFYKRVDSRHKLPIAPNLLGQRFSTTAPNQAWVGDITHIWPAEGWAYLAVLLELSPVASSAGRYASH